VSARTALGKLSIVLPGIVTEQDREIVRRRAAGETRKAICQTLGVTVAMVQRAEWRCTNDARGRGLLVDCHDSIEGLSGLASWTAMLPTRSDIIIGVTKGRR